MSFEWIEVDLLPISQKGNVFYVGKVKATDLLEIFTVNPVQYDIQKQIAYSKTFPSDSDYFNYLVDENRRKLENFKNKGFQRDPDGSRASSIGRFIDDEEYSIFPNSIIATCDLINQHMDIGEIDKYDIRSVMTSVDTPHNLSYLVEDGDVSKLYIPKCENSLVIVDGQHRIEGLKRASRSIVESYEMLLSFIIGFDRSVIAKLFYTINYTQKSVNKSLLYHLTAEFSNELDEISFLHEVVKFLNEHEDSPFYQRVKMIGKSDKNQRAEVRKKQTISQAFFINYTLYTITKKSRKSDILPIFLPFYKSKHKILVVRFIMRFFMAIKEIFDFQWDDVDNSVLSKTTGVGALLRVLNFLVINLVVDRGVIGSVEKLDHVKVVDIKRALEGIQTVSLEKYARGGSAGKVNELAKDFLMATSFWKNITERGGDFKKEYTTPYWEWIGSLEA